MQIDYAKLERLEMKSAELRARESHLREKLADVSRQAELERFSASRILLTGVSRRQFGDFKSRLANDIYGLHRDLMDTAPDSDEARLVSGVVAQLKQRDLISELLQQASAEANETAGLLGRVRRTLSSIGG